MTRKLYLYGLTGEGDVKRMTEAQLAAEAGIGPAELAAIERTTCGRLTRPDLGSPRPRSGTARGASAPTARRMTARTQPDRGNRKGPAAVA